MSINPALAPPTISVRSGFQAAHANARMKSGTFCISAFISSSGVGGSSGSISACIMLEKRLRAWYSLSEAWAKSNGSIVTAEAGIAGLLCWKNPCSVRLLMPAFLLQ